MARRSSYRGRVWMRFEPTVPRAVEGGIKARALGTSWWAKRWLAALERFSDRARLGRGRGYARSGQVTTIDVQRGECRASVQGSRPKPYQVVIRLAALEPEAWKKVARALASESRHRAALLAGEVSRDIEDLFAKAGCPLFPEQRRDLVYTCTCPDWGDPCKHSAAVAYVLGEAFDADPFLMFRMRGMEKADLLGGLGTAKPIDARPIDVEPIEAKPERGQPLPIDLDAFWATSREFDVASTFDAGEGELVHELGAIPFWRANEPLEVVVADVQRRASENVLVLLGGGQAKGPIAPGAGSASGPRRSGIRGSVQGERSARASGRREAKT